MRIDYDGFLSLAIAIRQEYTRPFNHTGYQGNYKGCIKLSL